MKPCPRKVSQQITVWVRSDTPPFSNTRKGHIQTEYPLYAPGLCSVLFSMYCTTKEAYKNGASVYICTCVVVKISCKWACNTGLWSRSQDYFLLFGYLTFLCMKHPSSKDPLFFIVVTVEPEEMKEAYACEHDTLNITCAKNKVIELIYSNYGRTVSSTT